MSKRHKSKHVEVVGDDELPVIALDYKRRVADGVNCNEKGWKFYISIKDRIPDWWFQFNSNIHSGPSKYNSRGGKPKYHNARDFAEHKFKDPKNKQLRRWLEWMISPKKVWQREALSSGGPNSGKRYEVPWLGDWEARRRN